MNWPAVIGEFFGKSELLHTDFVYGPVTVEHEDGSMFVLFNAVMKERGGKVYVFTEHCGYFEFAKEDLKGFYQL